MSNPIKDLFKNKEYCYSELGKAMERSLAFMYLYCPDKIRSLVLATLNESGMRKFRFIKIWRNKEKENEKFSRK